MSDTDKTRPYWVRATEQPMRTCEPVHRHENGVCDLPENPSDLGPRWGSGECYWTEANAFIYGRDYGCGCRMCTLQVFRRQERRADRRAAAAVTRDAMRVHRSGDAEAIEDFDEWYRRPTRWW